MGLQEHLRVVLHQVKSADNLGGIARAMANFGFSQLWLSDPKLQHFREAQRMAVRADHVLSAMRVTANLSAALGEVVFSVGTTFRPEVAGRRSLRPEEAVAKLAEHAQRGKVALVFGGEQRGLSDDELSRCQELLVIPTSPVQPSMNLAQAGAVLLYLCGQAGVPGPAPAEPGEAASLQIIALLEEKMRSSMLASGFLNPQQPELLLRELVHTLSRAQLSRREAELWLAAFRQMERKLSPSD